MSENLNNVLVELVITSRCQGRCFDCMQCCGLFPTNKNDITLDKINSFVGNFSDISINTINMMGGEAFLHPRWKEILSAVMALRKKSFRPIAILYSKLNSFEEEITFLKSNYRVVELTKTKLMWSGLDKNYFDQYDIVLIPSYNSVVDLQDGYRYPKPFSRMNNAIIDFDIERDDAYLENCTMKDYGFSYNVNGWYKCNLGNAIDRVFGFGVGGESITSDMSKQDILCNYCGHYTEHCFKRKGLELDSHISKSWLDIKSIWDK